MLGTVICTSTCIAGFCAGKEVWPNLGKNVEVAAQRVHPVYHAHLFQLVLPMIDGGAGARPHSIPRFWVTP
ncbi:hypothetical protein F5Y07DRAFT_381222 [Xylaria sp. FL0933]|nr:hypothetical protein F5Y07DRAFT_381222 [Xylaria sp. FL0933]